MFGRTVEECEEFMNALENPVAYNSRRFTKPTRIVIDDPKDGWGDDDKDSKQKLCSSQKNATRCFKRMTTGPKKFLVLTLAAALIFWTVIYFYNF